MGSQEKGIRKGTEGRAGPGKPQGFVTRQVLRRSWIRQLGCRRKTVREMALSIFEYASSVLADYQNYVCSFSNPANECIPDLKVNITRWPERQSYGTLEL